MIGLVERGIMSATDQFSRKLFSGSEFDTLHSTIVYFKYLGLVV